jgi:hypothetical protein
MSEPIHYIVVGAPRDGRTSHRFTTEADAETEARRLAASSDGRTFVVYEARSTHKLPILSERCAMPSEPENLVDMSADEERR